MIEEMIHELFTRIGHTWKIGQEHRVPTVEDVRQVLDAAAGRLYDSPVGTQIQTGGLIIEKAPHGHDAYVCVGNYK